MTSIEASVCLVDKTCIPCSGSIPPMGVSEAQKLLSEVGNGWKINEVGHLFREYKFDDFMGPIAFANKIAELAEEEAHHPDITIAWGKCSIEIWTHKISGLTESDFILAAKIAAIA